MFKVGDRVKAVEAKYGWGAVERGDEGIIKNVEPNEYAVDFVKQKGWKADENDLVLVEKANPKLSRLEGAFNLIDSSDVFCTEGKIFVKQLLNILHSEDYSVPKRDVQVGDTVKFSCDGIINGYGTVIECSPKCKNITVGFMNQIDGHGWAIDGRRTEIAEKYNLRYGWHVDWDYTLVE